MSEVAQLVEHERKMDHVCDPNSNLSFHANIKNSRDKLIEIINAEYTTVLEEIEKLKV